MDQNTPDENNNAPNSPAGSVLKLSEPLSEQPHNSPHSLRLGVKAMRKWCGCSNTSEFARFVDQQVTLRKYNKRIGTSAAVWRKIECDGSNISYRHLEVLAKVSGIPVGAFLTMTHIVSRLRDGDLSPVISYANGLQGMGRVIKDLRIEPLFHGPDLEEKLQYEAFRILFETWTQHGLNVNYRNTEKPASILKPASKIID